MNPDLASLSLTGINNYIISNNKTGNMIFDIILGTISLIIISHINNNFETLFTKLKSRMKKFFKFSKRNEISFIANESSDKWGSRMNYPQSILAICHFAMKYCSNDVKEIKELLTQHRFDRHTKDDYSIEYTVGDTTFEIEKSIFCSIYSQNKEKKLKSRYEDDSDSVFNKQIHMSIWSDKFTIDHLKKFIDKCIKEYTFHMEEKTLSNQYYEEYTGCDEDILQFDEYIFKSNKTFENLFFNEKLNFMNNLKFFIDNQDWYIKRGIPYKLGILLYGPPGTGKTSLIKAILNETKRHAIVVPLSKIKTARQLTEIFYGSKINNKNMKSNKKVFVFEDIDCMSDIIHKRKDSPIKEPINLQNTPIINIVEDTLKINVNNNDNIKDKLTLNTILNLLDGILEDDGRILIMTTNHPEKLDPALTRPGRIDYHLDMNNCSHSTIVDIVNHNYDLQYTTDTFPKINEIKEYIWSPAEIIQLSINYKNIDDLITYLIGNNPITY